jgi:hypothetical protein
MDVSAVESVQAPALVVHRQGDREIPLAEEIDEERPGLGLADFVGDARARQVAIDLAELLLCAERRADLRFRPAARSARRSARRSAARTSATGVRPSENIFRRIRMRWRRGLRAGPRDGLSTERRVPSFTRRSGNRVAPGRR